MPTTNSGPSVSTFVNEVPLRGTFDPTGKLLQILGPGQTVAYDPANVAITGGTINGVAMPSNYNPAAVAITGGSAAFTGALSTTSTEATLALTTTGQKSYALISGGGGNLGNGYFAIRNITNGNNPLFIHPAAVANTVYVSDTGLAVTGVLTSTGLISPQQAAAAPAYVKGAMYFDTTLNKLRIGGATAWETVTSS